MELEQSIHSHPLIPFDKSNPDVFCFVCEKSLEDDVYGCAECLFYIHKSCAQSPPQIRHPLHRYHPITLHIFPSNDKQLCSRCCQRSSKLYRCQDGCDTLLDVECVSQSRSTVARFKNIGLRETEIQQSIHLHSFFPCEEVYQDPCFVCEKSLESSAACGCPVCNFCLHDSCAESPPEVWHSLHPEHKIKVKILPWNEATACSYCWRLGSKMFCCPEEGCDFRLDFQCAWLKYVVKSDLHEHPLALFKNSGTGNACKVCDAACWNSFLRCMECDVHFHIQCVASLPTKVKHTTHGHLLNLNDSLVEDDSEEFYCDACEKPRAANQTVYSCEVEDCDFVAHLYCGITDSEQSDMWNILKGIAQGGDVDPVLTKLDEEISQLRSEGKMIGKRLGELDTTLWELRNERGNLVDAALHGENLESCLD